MNKLRMLVILFFFSLVFGVSSSAAQDQNDLQLRISRNFGYSSGTGKVQGLFTLKASSSQDLARVVFYLDEQVVGEATQQPFQVKFHTDNYPFGIHTLYALGTTPSGSELRSNELRLEFVSAEQGWQDALRIIGPILVLTFGLIALSVLFPLITAGKHKHLPPGAPRNYGAAGGAICPRCKRPFPRNFLSPNMVVGKLERCPFCGKWSIVQARPLGELRAAEAAEIQDATEGQGVVEVSEQERLRRELENSRWDE